MLGNIFTIAYHSPGTLAADQTFAFVAPISCQLLHVSAVSSNASGAILDVGTPDAQQEYAALLDVGQSLVPAELDAPGDFVDDAYPHILAGTVVQAYLDHDGDAGIAARDFTLVLTFSAG